MVDIISRLPYLLNVFCSGKLKHKSIDILDSSCLEVGFMLINNGHHD